MWTETLGYREFRLPYLKELFAEVAKAAALTGAEDLLDLGCGAGEVALKIALYGASMTALDAEQPMLNELAKRAEAARRHVKLICAKVEEAALDLGRFQLITIGMAHWFMHSPETLERLERWLLPGGRVALCGHSNHLADDWVMVAEKIRRKWARSDLRKPRISPEEFFAGANFELNRVVEVQAVRSLTLENLLRRAQGYSTSSPAALGETNSRQMLAEISSAMAPFFRGGPIKETFLNRAHLFRRMGDD